MASDSKLDVLSLVAPPEGTFIYIAVKGSLHSSDCSIFGLSKDESKAISKRFADGQELVNGMIINGHILHVINSLSELGYSVVTSTGEGEITWTMKREV